MRRNKGFVLNLVELIPLMLLLGASIIVIIFIINGSTYYASDSFSTEASLFASELVYSPGGLSYYDTELGRYRPGIIDVSKLDQFEDILSDTFTIGGNNQKLGARITIYDNSDDFQTTINLRPEKDYNDMDFFEKFLASLPRPTELKFTVPLVTYYNRPYFDRWRVIASTGWTGPGGAQWRELYFSINTIHEDGMIYNGVMSVEVVGNNG